MTATDGMKAMTADVDELARRRKAPGVTSQTDPLIGDARENKDRSDEPGDDQCAHEAQRLRSRRYLTLTSASTDSCSTAASA